MYFDVEIDIGASMPNVWASIESPPKESIAVIQVTWIWVDSCDWLKREAPFVISKNPPSMPSMAVEENGNKIERQCVKKENMPVWLNASIITPNSITNPPICSTVSIASATEEPNIFPIGSVVEQEEAQWAEMVFFSFV